MGRKSQMSERRAKILFFLFVPFLISVLCGFLFFSACCSSRDSSNVIIIVVDTLRADHLGCYGYSRDTTPHIDSLAKESIIFHNTYSSSTWTTPSVASLFTSQYPAVLGYRVYPIELDASFLTLAEIFKQNSYATGGIISNIFLTAKLGFGQGFDTYDEEASWGLEGISSPSVTDKAIAFLEDNKGEKFFLYLHYNDPHYNYHLHENYDYYPQYKGPLFSGQSIQSLREALPQFSADDIEYLNALYDSEISYTDEYIGKLIRTLKDMGLYDDTLILLTADHGEEFAERVDPWIGHVIKVYQEVIKVPLLIKMPGHSAPKKVDDEVGLIDLVPTLVHSLRLKTSKDFAGVPIDLEKGVRPSKEYLVCETLREANKHSVIYEGWKYIIDYEKNKKELFNLEDDPGELNNMAKRMRELARDYEKMLYEWAADTQKKRSRLHLRSREPNFSDKQTEVLKSLGYIK